jgi:AcrR family transcriptional regulator
MIKKRRSSAGASASAARGSGAPDRIRKAGIALFKRFGYHGTSVRALADAVNMEAASLYHHFPSKQKLLAELFDRTMDELLEGLQQALATDGGHEQQLRNAVRFHVRYHIDRQDEAFVSHSELRSLSAPSRKRINAKRDRYEHMLRSFLEAGVKAGEFAIHDVPIMTIAILTMCSGVSDWFTPRGRLSADQVADEYAEIVLGLIRRPGGSGSGRRAAVRKSSRHGEETRRAGSAAGARAVTSRAQARGH